MKNTKTFKIIISLVLAIATMVSATSLSLTTSSAATWTADISPISNHPSTLGHQMYAGCINGMSFQQDGIVSYNGYQYAAYWNSSGYLTLARRQYNKSGASFGNWQELTFKYQITKFNNPDSHNTISIGISKGDGVLHLAFDTHAVENNYMMSTVGFLNDPSKFTVNNFYGSYKCDYLGTYGSTWQRMITYPRFLSLLNGDMIFEFRQGNSGCANNFFYYYTSSTHTWKEIGAYVHGSKYNDYSDLNASYCAYINGLNSKMVNGKERIYTTWCTRDTGDNNTNKDLYAAYSDDYGYTWYSLTGVKVADLKANEDGGIPYGTTATKEYSIPLKGSGLMNQTSQWVDEAGVVHTINKHTLDAAKASTANVPYDFSTYSDQYVYHYWMTTDGKCYRERVGDALPHYWTRYPVVSYGGCLYVVMNQLRIYKGTPKSGNGNNSSGYTWTKIYDNSAKWLQGKNNVCGSYGCEPEPLVDRELIKDGILSIMDLGSDKGLYTFDINLNKLGNNTLTDANISYNNSKGATAMTPAEPMSPVGSVIKTQNEVQRLYSFRTIAWWDTGRTTFSLQSGATWSSSEDRVIVKGNGGTVVNSWGFRSEGYEGLLFYVNNKGSSNISMDVQVNGTWLGSQTVAPGVQTMKFPFKNGTTFNGVQMNINLWGSNVNATLSDVYGYTGNVVPTQTQPQPTQSQATTQPQPTQTQTQPAPVTGDTFMPADKWESAWGSGSISKSGGYVTGNWTEGSAEYAIYDYNYHKNVNLPADTKALKFTVVVNSVGNQNVPLEIYMGGNNTALGKYSGTFIDIGKGSEVVGKSLTFTYNLSDFAGGAGGAEKRAVTVDQLKAFEPLEFRVRADDQTTNLGGINYSVSDIVAVSESGSTTTTKATTVAPTTTTTTTTKATTTTTTTTTGTQPIKKGDVNGDGELNVTDVQALLVLVQKGQKGDTRVTDMNNDGNVDIIDVNLLLNMVLKG